MERRNRVDAGGGGGPRGGAVTSDQPTARAVWVRLVVFVAIVAAAGTIAGIVGLPDVERLRTGIASAGPGAPALFVLLYAVATLAPVPKNVLATVAGVLFGLALGIVVVLLGALLGALAAFALGRALGRATVERITGARVARVDALLRRRGLLAVIGVRLVPVGCDSVIWPQCDGADSSDRRNTGGIRELRWLGVGRVRRRRRRSVSSSLG
jgi:hypothetical protein